MACSNEALARDEDGQSFCELLTGLEEGSLLDGKYSIDGVLGVGGMGVVLAATHLDLDRPVAIKVLRAELAGEDRIVARLLCEGRAAAQIRSRHVTQVIDVGRLPKGAPYVVMERLDGVGFDHLVEQHGALPLSEVADAIVEVCEALAEAHTAGIVHRDLKPANLFLARHSDGSTTVKLLDFGISKSTSKAHRRSLVLTDPHLALGSPNYMAPEQIKAADDVDPRADIWALGAIIYELLTARQAFDSDDVNVLQAKILLEEHTPLRALRPDLPQSIDRVVRRCLMKDREARYPDVETLVRDLAPHGSLRAAQSAERIHRLFSGSTGGDSVPPGSGDYAAVLPVSGAASSLGRIVGWASAAAALVFVVGLVTVWWLTPEQRELRSASAALAVWTGEALRVARTEPEPEPAPAPEAEPEPNLRAEQRAVPDTVPVRARPAEPPLEPAVQAAPQPKAPWWPASRRAARFRPVAP